MPSVAARAFRSDFLPVQGVGLQSHGDVFLRDEARDDAEIPVGEGDGRGRSGLGELLDFFNGKGVLSLFDRFAAEAQEAEIIRGAEGAGNNALIG